MTATSITGKGLGSADKRQKGDEHLRIGAEKIIGPRVVYVKQHTLDGSGDLTVKIPAPSGASASDYLVITTDATSTAATACAASLAVTSGNFVITLKGTASQATNVLLLKVGLAI